MDLARVLWPIRSLMQLCARVATFCLWLAAFVIYRGGAEGAPVALRSLDLLVIVLLVAAVDQWIVVPSLRGLGTLSRAWAARLERPNP